MMDEPAMEDDDKKCQNCRAKFSFLLKRHRCKICLRPFCQSCSNQKVHVDALGTQVRTCGRCSSLIAGECSTNSNGAVEDFGLPEFEQAEIELAKSISLATKEEEKDLEMLELEKALQLSLRETNNSNFDSIPTLYPSHSSEEQEKVSNVAISEEDEKMRKKIQRQLEMAQVKAVLGTKKCGKELTPQIFKASAPSAMNLEQVGAKSCPAQLVHSKYYKNVIPQVAPFYNKNDLQGQTGCWTRKRESVDDFNGFAFIKKPIQEGDSLVLKILQKELSTNMDLIWYFGVTACDPSKISGSSLPLAPYDLLDRPEYWAVSHWDANELNVGDEFCFHFSDSGGNISTSKNGGPSFTSMDVPKSLLSLWFFAHLRGPINEIGLLGTRTMDVFSK